MKFKFKTTKTFYIESCPVVAEILWEKPKYLMNFYTIRKGSILTLSDLKFCTALETKNGNLIFFDSFSKILECDWLKLV